MNDFEDWKTVEETETVEKQKETVDFEVFDDSVSIPTDDGDLSDDEIEAFKRKEKMETVRKQKEAVGTILDNLDPSQFTGKVLEDGSVLVYR